MHIHTYLCTFVNKFYSSLFSVAFDSIIKVFWSLPDQTIHEYGTNSTKILDFINDSNSKIFISKDRYLVIFCRNPCSFCPFGSCKDFFFFNSIDDFLFFHLTSKTDLHDQDLPCDEATMKFQVNLDFYHPKELGNRTSMLRWFSFFLNKIFFGFDQSRTSRPTSDKFPS